MADFESDLTRFLRELKQQRPEIEAQQRIGRAIWWDKELDLEEQERRRAAAVPRPGYAYFAQPRRLKG